MYLIGENELKLLPLLNQGKTKRIYANPQDPQGSVLVVSADDITAGDGAKHDVMTGKGVLANQTTCNVFRLLVDCGLPVAFTEQIADNAFTAPRCHMLPYEVVVRRKALGSALKRKPWLKENQPFERLVVEFYLKTNGRKWKDRDLPCDDPFMIASEGGVDGVIKLYDPAIPLDEDNPFLTLDGAEVHRVECEAALYPEMVRIARQTFLILEKAWQLQGGELVDFKVEFGIGPNGKLLLADVIDADSWRVLIDGQHVSKQVYRDGATLDKVLKKFILTEEHTRRFHLPKQQVPAFWTGSPSDDTTPIEQAIKTLGQGNVTVTKVVCSMHKEPIRGIMELNHLVRAIPDTVVIALIGRSNGAGPTLSAATTAPVITVPAGYREFPDDVWSSLRTPSGTPVMTVLEPGNAALAALNILSSHNPMLHMHLREKLEERQANVMVI